MIVFWIFGPSAPPLSHFWHFHSSWDKLPVTLHYIFVDSKPFLAKNKKSNARIKTWFCVLCRNGGYVAVGAKRTLPIAWPARVRTLGTRWTTLTQNGYVGFVIYLGLHMHQFLRYCLLRNTRWCENQIALFVMQKSQISTPWIVTLQLSSLFNMLLTKHNVYTTRKNLIKKWIIMNTYVPKSERITFLLN